MEYLGNKLLWWVDSKLIGRLHIEIKQSCRYSEIPTQPFQTPREGRLLVSEKLKWGWPTAFQHLVFPPRFIFTLVTNKMIWYVKQDTYKYKKTLYLKRQNINILKVTIQSRFFLAGILLVIYYTRNTKAHWLSVITMIFFHGTQHNLLIYFNNISV